jgi:hypothetical protein
MAPTGLPAPRRLDGRADFRVGQASGTAAVGDRLQVLNAPLQGLAARPEQGTVPVALTLTGDPLSQGRSVAGGAALTGSLDGLRVE